MDEIIAQSPAQRLDNLRPESLFWLSQEPPRIQMDDSDRVLVLACRRGDQLAWEKLIRRYQRLIYAIPLRAGLDEDQAAEIFQDVFTTFFQKLNDIEEPEKLQAWLVTTARRKTWRTIAKSHATEWTNEAGTVSDQT